MNKRKHPRQRAGNVAAHLKVENRTALANVEDISESGLFVRTHEDLPLGLVVAVDLARPGLKKALHLTGKVVRHGAAGKKGIGVAFDSLDRDTRPRLLQLIADLGGAKSTPAADRFTPIELPLELEEVAPLERDASPPPQSAEPPQVPEPDQAKLFIQIRGLIMELGTRDQTLRQKDETIEQLRRELAAAKEEIDSLKAKGRPEASAAVRHEANEALAHLQALAMLLGPR